jgi:hypothetical protein
MKDKNKTHLAQKFMIQVKEKRVRFIKKRKLTIYIRSCNMHRLFLRIVI